MEAKIHAESDIGGFNGGSKCLTEGRKGNGGGGGGGCVELGSKGQNLGIVGEALEKSEDTLETGFGTSSLTVLQVGNRRSYVKLGNDSNPFTVEDGAKKQDDIVVDLGSFLRRADGGSSNNVGEEAETTGNDDLLSSEVSNLCGKGNQNRGEKTQTYHLSNEQIMGAELEERRYDESEGVNLVVDLSSCFEREGGNERKKRKFSASDLVWGKVRSHPWWPGQIFELEDASEMAKKYSNPNTYLVAYFGDQSFSWNEESKLKVFSNHFSRMEKQSDLEAFQHAVDCALDEASRRVELALSCRCISNDIYSRMETQDISNAGIREESSSKASRDRFFTALSFDPVNFLDYVKTLAQVPLTKVEKLDYVMSRAQLLAFCRWKGHYRMAECEHYGLLTDETDSLGSGERKDSCKMVKDGARVAQERERLSHNRNYIFSDKGRPSLKRRFGGYSEKETEVKTGRGRKRKTVESSDDDPDMNVENYRHLQLIDDQLSQETKHSLRVGKNNHENALFHGKTSKGISKQSKRRRKTVQVEHPSPDEMLSQLVLAARDPMNRCNFTSSLVSFFSDLRESVLQNNGLSSLHQKHEDSGAEVAADKSRKGVSPEEKESDSKSTISVHEEHILLVDENGAILANSQSANGVSTNKTSGFCSNPQTDHPSRSENTTPESVQIDEVTDKDDSPTALILNFSCSDSIPPKGNLNQIFSRYGPLKESETQVLKKRKRAKVVFKRRSDAETAFSSSGKFNIFGPSLIRYSLNYAPSLCEASSAKQCKK